MEKKFAILVLEGLIQRIEIDLKRGAPCTVGSLDLDALQLALLALRAVGTEGAGDSDLPPLPPLLPAGAPGPRCACR